MIPGFFIRELRLSGVGVQDAIITFTRGLNVVIGPTGTGKSYIYQCLNYMLGSSKAPKPIKQAKAYSNIILQIESFDSIQYKFTTDLKGGDFILESAQLNIKKNIERKHNADDIDNISIFLLEINKLSGKKIRTNASGLTRNISYRDISRFIMVDENRIITDSSPIVSGQYISATAEKSVFKFLLTGKDDSDIISTKPSKDEVKFRTGKIQMLDELLLEHAAELNDLPNVSDSKQKLLEIDEELEDLKLMHFSLKFEFDALDDRRLKISDEISSFNNNKIYNEELLKRSRILKDQYKIDVKRLNSTIEASYLLSEGSEGAGNCPICQQPLENHEYDHEISLVNEACKLEISKINKLLLEVDATEEILLSENSTIDKNIEKLKENLRKVNDDLEKGTASKMETILNRIGLINGRKLDLIKSIVLQERNEALEFQKNLLSQSILKSTGDKFGAILTSQVQELSEILLEILKACNYPNISGVTYSEAKMDFVISGEDRELSGKGLRAITYACFLLSLQELVYRKGYSIGPCIMDSPLVTYKKPKAGGEHITSDLAMDFYRYSASNKKVGQIIILENEEPPADILNLINVINFSGRSGDGRQGFIPL